MVSKIMVFAFRPKRTKRLLGHFSLGQNLGNGWSKSIVLENKVVFNFDLGNGAKKSDHWGHSFQSYVFF